MIINYPKARELNEKVYQLRCEVLGEKHSSTLISLNNLAYCNDKLGDYTKAVELQEKLYILRCEVLGKDDPKTIKSLERLNEYKAKI